MDQTTAAPFTDRAEAEDGAPRTCGTCTLCCVLPDIDALDKPANHVCRHCVEDQGCLVYDRRPGLCRDFLCLWMTSTALGDHWQPAIAGMMAYRQGPQVTVLVDPRQADRWRQEPYRTELGLWAAKAEQDGGYLILFQGETAIRIRPLP